MELEKLMLKIAQYTGNLFRESNPSAESEAFSNLSLNEYYYLEALYQLSTASYSELAEYLNFSKPSVTNMISKLIKKGYIIKEQSIEDKRKYYLCLTDKGQNVIQLELEIYKEFVENIKNILREDEFKMYEAILNKIVHEVVEKSRSKP